MFKVNHSGFSQQQTGRRALDIKYTHGSARFQEQFGFGIADRLDMMIVHVLISIGFYLTKRIPYHGKGTVSQ